MVNSVTDIFNLACSTIGTRSSIASEDEASVEAEECRLWYPAARDIVLEAAHWPATRAVSSLAVLAERDTSADWASGDPEPGYLYAYGLPEKMLRPWYLVNFDRFTLGRLKSSPERVALMTNTEDAVLVYSYRSTSIEEWSMPLKLAVAHALGAFAGLKLTGKRARVARAQERANDLIMTMRASAANMREDQYETIPEWFQARGIGIAAPQSRFLYPYGALVSTLTESFVVE